MSQHPRLKWGMCPVYGLSTDYGCTESITKCLLLSTVTGLTQSFMTLPLPAVHGSMPHGPSDVPACIAPVAKQAGKQVPDIKIFRGRKKKKEVKNSMRVAV